jgi:hypothetical protein
VTDEVIAKFREVLFPRLAKLETLLLVLKLEVVQVVRGFSVGEAIKIYLQDASVCYAEPNYVLKNQLI